MCRTNIHIYIYIMVRETIGNSVNLLSFSISSPQRFSRRVQRCRRSLNFLFKRLNYNFFLFFLFLLLSFTRSTAKSFNPRVKGIARRNAGDSVRNLETIDSFLSRLGISRCGSTQRSPRNSLLSSLLPRFFEKSTRLSACLFLVGG